jgi:hypothetical protein
VTPVYPVNPCGVYLRETCMGQSIRDNPAFSSQAANQG